VKEETVIYSFIVN